jgi:hypothetical protein
MFLVDFGDCQLQGDGRILVGMKCLGTMGLVGHCPKKLYILFGKEAWENASKANGN